MSIMKICIAYPNETYTGGSRRPVVVKYVISMTILGQKIYNLQTSKKLRVDRSQIILFSNTPWLTGKTKEASGLLGTLIKSYTTLC